MKVKTDFSLLPLLFLTITPWLIFYFLNIFNEVIVIGLLAACCVGFLIFLKRVQSEITNSVKCDKNKRFPSTLVVFLLAFLLKDLMTGNIVKHHLQPYLNGKFFHVFSFIILLILFLGIHDLFLSRSRKSIL